MPPREWAWIFCRQKSVWCLNVRNFFSLSILYYKCVCGACVTAYTHVEPNGILKFRKMLGKSSRLLVVHVRISLLRCIPPHVMSTHALKSPWCKFGKKGGIFRWCHPYFKWIRATGLSNYNGLRWPHAAAREEGKDTTGEILLKMPTENGKRHTAAAAHKMCSAKNSIQFWQGLRQDRMK